MFSRDAALALGYGASNLVGAVNVWADGSGKQQRGLARLLLGGGRVSAAYTDLATGNDVVRSAFSARRDGDQLLLNGRKEIINNLARAEAITVLARTGEEPGSRSHSLLLLDRAALPRDGYELLPRYRTAGVRAMYLGGMAFRDCAVPASSIVGEPGHALETILRAFQVTRAVLPSAALGGMDSALRTVAAFSATRRLYGRRVADLPHARAVLAGAFVDPDLRHLATDGVPGLPCCTRSAMYSAAVKYRCRCCCATPSTTSPSCWAHGRSCGPVRTPCSRSTCGTCRSPRWSTPAARSAQATMIPQLRSLSRTWLRAAAAGPELFGLDAPLPDLDLPGLSVIATGDDAVLATLWQLRDALPPDGHCAACATPLSPRSAS